MSFFTFCTKLLRDPVALSTMYFQGGEAQPRLERWVQYLYVSPVVLHFLFVSLPGWFYAVYVVDDPMIRLFNVLGLVLALPVRLLLGVMQMWLGKWVLGKAVAWNVSGAKPRLIAGLSLYMVTHNQALMLVNFLLGRILWVVGMVVYMAVPDGALEVMVWVRRGASVCTGLLIFVRGYDVWYRLLRMWTDAKPWPTFFTHIALWFGLILFVVLVCVVLGVLAVLWGDALTDMGGVSDGVASYVGWRGALG